MPAYKTPDIELLSPFFEQFALLKVLSSELPFSYLVQHKTAGRQATLYIVPKQMAAKAGWDGSFMARAKEAIKLQHPNLMKVESAGEAGDFLYVIAERTSDPSLEQIASRLPLPPHEVLQAIKGLANGMDQAHGRGIIHGRLDTVTIHINSRNFCRVLPLNVRPGKAVPGQEAFYAPETGKRNARLEPRDDVYSLGMAMYWMLTGGLPSRKGNLMPSCVCSCTHQVDELVSRAIHPDRNVRFSSLGSMVQVLDDTLPNAEKEKKAPGNINRKPLVIIDRGEPLTYFFLIPFLLVLIVFSYVVLCYQQDRAKMVDEYNALISKNNKQAPALPGAPR